MMNSMSQPGEQTEGSDDLVRIPANSKSKFSLEEQHADNDQHVFCNSFLGSVGINRDLVDQPRTFLQAEKEDPYLPPKSQEPLIVQNPEDLASDLYQCTTCSSDIYTVEDKGPSVLWRMRNFSIFIFWYNLMANCTDRWETQDISNEEILRKYRTILDNILPKS